ncbi:SocA family protein [Candidatus Bipolaricaulota bacterium]|nr:SocA family protein [Candidatus Bipolaricaulota bacterium]
MAASSFFDEEKSTAMALYLLQKCPNQRMNYLKLIKLMYIADREALRQWGHPLTGDAYFSLPHGPVVSRIKDLITDDPEFSGGKVWTSCIHRLDRDVEAVAEGPMDSLSSAERELLDRVFASYGSYTPWQLVELTHTFPEWRDPQGSAEPITYKDILCAVGRGEESDELVENIEVDAALRRALTHAARG